MGADDAEISASQPAVPGIPAEGNPGHTAQGSAPEMIKVPLLTIFQNLFEGFSGANSVTSCVLVSVFVTSLLCAMLRFAPDTMFLATPFAMSFGMSLYFLASCKFKASRLLFWVATLPVFKRSKISLAEREAEFKSWGPRIVALIRFQIAMSIFILGFWGFLIMYDAEQDESGTESTTELGVTTETNHNQPKNDNSATTPQTAFLYGLFLVVVGPGLCMMFYGYLQWRNAKYMPSLEAFTCVVLGFISFHLYFFLLIFARGMGGSEVNEVEDISFFAVSVVMLSMNAYILTILFYRNPSTPQMDVIKLLNDSSGKPPSSADVEALEENVKRKKLRKQAEESKSAACLSWFKKGNLIWYGISWVVLAIYWAIVRYGPMEPGVEGLGGVTCAIVVSVDFVMWWIYSWGIVHRPAVASAVSFIARFALAATPVNYWFVGPSMVFVVLMTFLAFHTAAENKKLASNHLEDQKLLENLIRMCKREPEKLDKDKAYSDAKLRILETLVWKVKLCNSKKQETLNSDEMESGEAIGMAGVDGMPSLVTTTKRKTVGDAQMAFKKKTLLAVAVGLFAVFTALIRLDDEVEIFTEVPMNDIQLWHNSYSMVYVGVMAICIVLVVYVFATCYFIFTAKAALLEHYSESTAQKWAWSRYNPFESLDYFRTEGMTPRVKEGDEELWEQDGENVRRMYCGFPEDVWAIFLLFGSVEAVCLTIAALLWLLSDDSHVIIGGFLICSPGVFLISIVVGKSFVDNDSHFLDYDAIYRFLHRKNHKIKELEILLTQHKCEEYCKQVTELVEDVTKAEYSSRKLIEYKTADRVETPDRPGRAATTKGLKERLTNLIFKIDAALLPGNNAPAMEEISRKALELTFKILKNIESKSGKWSAKDIRMATGVGFILAFTTGFGLIVATGGQKYSGFSALAVGLSLSYVIMLFGSLILAYLVYVFQFQFTMPAKALLSLALGIHIAWMIFMEASEFHGQTDFTQSRTILLVCWSFGFPSVCLIATAVRAYSTREVQLKFNFYDLFHNGENFRGFTVMLLLAFTLMIPVWLVLWVNVEWHIMVGVMVTLIASLQCLVTYLKWRHEKQFFLPDKWYYAMVATSLAAVSLSALYAIVFDWWFIGFSIGYLILCVLPLAYGFSRFDKSKCLQDLGRQVVPSHYMFPVFEIQPSGHDTTEKLVRYNACCAMVVAGFLFMSYWGMLAAVWWRVEAVGLCSVCVFCIYLFTMEMTASSSQAFAAATRNLFSDELQLVMQAGFGHAQSHYKAVSSESSDEYLVSSESRNFGFGLWVRSGGQSLWRAKKPFVTSAWKLWQQHCSDPETLVQWQGVFDNNNTQINSGNVHSEEQTFFSSCLKEKDEPGKETNWLKFQKANRGLDKAQAASRLGLTKSSNTEGVLLRTCGEYVRFDHSDAVFTNKYGKDLRFLAHFVGHVILQSQLTVKRRKRWIQQEFGRLLSAADVRLIQKVLESSDIWIANTDDECIRQPGAPPPESCWCDDCQKQKVYMEVTAIVEAKQAARQDSVSSSRNNKRMADTGEWSDKGLFAAALEADNEHMSEWIRSCTDGIDAADGFSDGLDAVRSFTDYKSSLGELTEASKPYERRASSKREEYEKHRANTDVNEEERQQKSSLALIEMNAANAQMEDVKAQATITAGTQYQADLGWLSLAATHTMRAAQRAEELETAADEEDFKTATMALAPRVAWAVRCPGHTFGTGGSTGRLPICENCAQEHIDSAMTHELCDERFRFKCLKGSHCKFGASGGDGQADYTLLVEELRAEKEAGGEGMFVDPEFPPEDSSLYVSTSTVQDYKVKEWERLANIYGKEKFDLMAQSLTQNTANDFAPDDVKQGRLSDCWFLSAATVTAQAYPHMLSGVNSTVTDETEGCFVGYAPDVGIAAFRFWKNFKCEIVLVDDMIPVDDKGQPSFADARWRMTNRSTGLWVPLMEKAYAKLHKSYEAISEGYVSDGLADLTHGIGDQYTLTDPLIQTQIENGVFWNKMISWKKAGHLLGGGTPDMVMGGGDEKDRPVIDGIVQVTHTGLPESNLRHNSHYSNRCSACITGGHAYGILDVMDVEGHRLIKLRNPWANEVEWVGRWSDGSDLWTERMKKRLHFVDADDGEFWMAFDDFCAMFLYLFVCRVFDSGSSDGSSWIKVPTIVDKWSGRTAGGGPSSSTFGSNPQWIIQAAEPTEVFIALTQEDSRAYGRPFFHTGLWLLDTKGELRVAQPDSSNTKARSAEYNDFRTCTLEVNLGARSQFALVPTTFDPGLEGKFTIDIYSKKTLLIRKCKT